MNFFQTLTVILSLLVVLLIILLIVFSRRARITISILESKQKSLESSVTEITNKEKNYQRLLDKIIESIPFGFLITDSQTRIIKINENILDLFYLERDKTIGSKTILVFNNNNLEDLIGKALKQLKPQNKEVIFYGDEDLSLEIDIIPINLDNYMLLLLFKNTTQEVEFSKLRSQFVANVSHEMRTPLTSIKGYIETAVENDLEDKEITKKYLQRTLGEIDRLSLLIEDILNLSNIEYKRNIMLEKSNDIIAIITECIISVEYLARKNEVEIIFNHEKEKLFLNTDEELFRQLVRNMIENTIFHGGKGIELNITLNENDTDITLAFSDNGVGVEKKDLPFIFQRFYRGHNPDSSKKIGSGLGLAIVKHIVELHGGSVNIKSTPGVETSFLFKFPKKRQL